MKFPSNRMVGAMTYRTQRGVVLFIALIVLVAMTLAGIGMARSVDTLNIVANNIAFGQNNLMVADWGAEQAFQWLVANNTTLDNDQPTKNYYARNNGGVDPDSWLDASAWGIANTLDSAPSGYTVYTIIQRMCVQNGSKDDGGQSCIRTTSITSSTNTTSTAVDINGVSTAVGGSVAAGSSAGGGAAYNLPGNVYFRITVRVEGPRNAVNVVQTLVAVPT